MHIEFPVEFMLPETPLSLGASGSRREAWKRRVADAAREGLPEGFWSSVGPVSALIVYFPPGPMDGDIDNIVKPILDGLNRVVYMDDRQVDRVLVRRIDRDQAVALSAPTATLLRAWSSSPPVVYVRIDDDASRGDPLWL